VDFVGELNNGTLSTTLSRGGSTHSGWQLMGNPYPSPISWTNLLILNPQIDGAVWRRIPTGQYAGI
jgi:trimeric autotransporter adhesin